MASVPPGVFVPDGLNRRVADRIVRHRHPKEADGRRAWVPPHVWNRYWADARTCLRQAYADGMTDSAWQRAAERLWSDEYELPGQPGQLAPCEVEPAHA